MSPTFRALWLFLGEGREEEAPSRMQPGEGIRFVLIPRLTLARVALLHNLHAPHDVLGRAMAPTHSAVGKAWKEWHITTCCTC